MVLGMVLVFIEHLYGTSQKKMHLEAAIARCLGFN